MLINVCKILVDHKVIWIFFYSLNKTFLWKLNMDQSSKIENWLSQNAYDVFMNEVEIEDKFKKCLKEIQIFK